MSLPPLQKLSRLLEQSVQEQIFSGFQLVAENSSGLTSLAGGFTSYWPDKTPVTENTFFDIGSVTKVVFTTTVVAQLVQSKKWNLGATVGSLRSEFVGTPYEPLTLRSLLSHSAGFVAHLELPADITYARLPSWFKDHASQCLGDKPGVKTIYSDLGFLLLGLCLEKVAPLADLFRDYVTQKFSLANVAFGPIENNVATTEFSLTRQRFLRGEVFDENTFALTQKLPRQIAPHAGLFSSARSLAPWAREWLKAGAGTSRLIEQLIAQEFAQISSVTADSPRGLGWDLRSPENSSAGILFSSKSFGHLGYPGASVWIDPEQKGFVIFLTNRVHPSRCDNRIRRVRPQVHDLIAEHWRTHANHT